MLSDFLWTWSHFRSVWVSVFSVFLWHLVSLSLCMGLYVVRLSMLLDLTSVSAWVSMFSEFLCHFRSVLVSMFPSFYVTWSHFRYVWFSMLFGFLCHLVSPSFCMGLYVVTVSMSLGLTSVMYGSLCCLNFYVTWSHFRYPWFSMLSQVPCHLVSLLFCMVLYVLRVSMSLGLISVIYGSPCCLSFFVTWTHLVLYGSQCCPSFYVTWSLFHSTWVSMLSEFLCHLVSLSLCCPIFCIGFVLPLCSSLCYLCS